MVPYTPPNLFAQLAGETYDFLNDKIGRKVGKYRAKFDTYHQTLLRTQQSLSNFSPVWHQLLLEEELRNLRQVKFADGVQVPDIWALSYPIMEFGFYLIKVDPADSTAPLLVDYYFHDQRRGHQPVLSLRQATCYTSQTLQGTNPRIYPYLAPEYLPWIQAQGQSISQDGSRYLLQPPLMLQLAAVSVQPTLTIDERAIRPLTLFRARRLRTLLRRHRTTGPWNVVLVDFPEGTCMHWGATKHASAVYQYYPDPLDATALWDLIDGFNYLEPHIRPRGWVELEEGEQQALLTRLEHYIKIHTLQAVLQAP